MLYSSDEKKKKAPTLSSYE